MTLTPSPGPLSQTATINGATIAYESSGAGHPLLLIHAGVADSRMWHPQLPAFTPHYQVTRYDLRGFGQSSWSPGRFAHHHDVAALLDLLGIAKTHIVGISFGGRTALDFTLAYPHRVTALVLCAPSVSGAEPAEEVVQFFEAEEAALARGDLDGATELNLRLWVDGPHRTPDQVAPEVRQLVGAMQHLAFTIPVPEDAEEDALDPPAIERLGEVQVPTLVISGALDLDEKLLLANQLATEMPHARHVVIPGAAHIMSLEQPERFNQLVLDFLATIHKNGRV